MASIFNKVKGTFRVIKGETTLYYPGCMTKYGLLPILNKYKSLLSDLGIDFRIIDEIDCCGSPLLNGGYTKDFEEIKEKNIKILNKHGITKVITNCPHCFHIFKNYYFINVEHISQTIEAHKHKINYHAHQEIAYHDPCLLARNNNVTKEPRAILRQAGFKIIEPVKSRQRTFCCGAGGGLKQNSPKIADALAKERLKQLGAKKVVVSCPYCYAHLSENCEGKKKIIELSEALVEE
ncbi:MAG TPA: (Fe-S)-binding protein [Candidatus Nanoarchaeia archaeon]|nr:(Fe-S)-binding protein [Candidatus Nanoarchaeia archaeon]